MLTNQPVLVVGGAGYIGSHMVWLLRQAGIPVVVLDDLRTGHREAVTDAVFIKGDAGNRFLLEQLFKKYAFSAVMHFASLIEVGESVRRPEAYYQNNVEASLTLLDCLLSAKVKQFIFSSSAAVYGEPRDGLMTEEHPRVPINPYGRTKYLVEEQLALACEEDGLHYAALRYFNAAGAHPDGLLAERHQPESHLIPLVLQVAKGERESITIFGNDYPTPDGTCVRDYVHVMDICQAHWLAWQQLMQGERRLVCNLGSGQGFSVHQVIQSVERVTGKTIPVVNGKRRAGDPAILVADPTRAKQCLKWQPQYTDLDQIVRHAWVATASREQVA